MLSLPLASSARSPRSLALWLALTPLLACGGAIEPELPGGDSGASDSAMTSSGGDGRATGEDAGVGVGYQCVLQPQEGDPCSAASMLCGVPSGCGDAPWACVSGRWTLLSPVPCLGG